jgi:hypothetical protein
MKRLLKLNTQHKAAARLRVEGRTNEQIAEDLGVAIRTLHVWFSDDLVKQEIRRLLERVEDVFVERKATAGLRALEELSRFSGKEAGKQLAVCRACGWFGMTPANHGDPQAPCSGPWEMREQISESTKLEALREVLDRVDETTTLRDRARAQEALNSGGEGDGQTNYVQIFQQMSDADLARVMQRWAANQGPPDIAVNGHGDAHGTPALPG